MRLIKIFMSSLTMTLVFGQSTADLGDKSKVAFTPHNFSGIETVGGDGVVYDFTLCRQCHTPSKMAPIEPLWYRKEAVNVFEVKNLVQGQDDEVLPSDAASRNCLFCHDGGIAPGFPHHSFNGDKQVALNGGMEQSIPNQNLHLFKFQKQSAQTHPPESESQLRLNKYGQISCTTCHDPHNNEYGNFLRVEAQNSQICFECHEMANWELSTHGNPADPKFSGLGDNACATCHDIHSVPAEESLLKTDQNTLCLTCHDGMKNSSEEIAANADLASVFDKTFIHPIRVNASGNRHTDMDAWSAGIADDRAVACSDCHNPHATSDQSLSPFLDGSQLYVDGVDNRGFPKAFVDYEYETCYKCHGMNQNAGLGRDVGRLFARTNMSYHPVEAPGNNPYVPSLKTEWSEQSMLSCTDCHGNDDPLGAQGPHGSNVPHILKASFADFPFSSVEENKLCFRCHEEQRVVQSNGFKYHQLHIQDAGYSCSACHNPHGSIEYPGLMDLSQGFIQPLNNGVLEIVQTEPGHGYCSLKCHDKAHPTQTY
ncbi:MAG: ammonia-forming cytochrome c nitrite reductase subunit c552 [Candidatus Marinimicrobia bacterium]|nr:ammonia-forming cytochrome c nitrite reductase subunit c552 [Candidatus Neomarinimicrobiota bacterium]